MQVRLWRSVGSLQFFTSNQWLFDMTNVVNLLSRMCAEDRQVGCVSFVQFYVVLTLLVECKKWGDDGGGHWLVRMEWRPAGWSVCPPLLIFPCTIQSRSSLLSPAHPGGPGKRAIKWLWCVWCD